MVLRKYEAFLDGMQDITVVVPKHFEQRHLRFTLESQSTPAEVIPLRLDADFDGGFDMIYRLLLPEPIDLDKAYQLYDQDRNEAPLQYRKVVQTATFDQHFYYEGDDLGASYTPEATTFKLWAPTAQEVVLMIEKAGLKQAHSLCRSDKGVWSLCLSGDFEGAPYNYILKVNGTFRQVHDPYAFSSEINSKRSYVVDRAKFLPVTHDEIQVPMAQSVIYELSVRDFTWQTAAQFTYAGKYLGLTESRDFQGQRIGLDYLKKLGITHVQLMPVYDFASVDEANQGLLYNWGYDPSQYNVPEGSFSTAPNDPYARIHELQKAIAVYHENNISVIMDVVYNHVYDLERFAFERILPGYFSRHDAHHQPCNGTGCGNETASERLMVRKYIIDSLLYWVKAYGLDGFRFDLMGILDIETINQAARTLKAIYPNIYLYGEGWDMAQGLHKDLTARQYNAHQMPEVGFFNDAYRETLKTTIAFPNSLVDESLRHKIEDLLSASIGKVLPYQRYLQVHQTVNYLECHDNATFFDYLRISLPSLHLEEQLAKARFGLQLLLISQGVVFLHSGQEFFRTKNHLDNTYNSPDSINRLDWTRAVEFQQDVDFISQLIAFRRAHRAFSIPEVDQLKAATTFYWLNNQVLKYSLHYENEHFEIILNFSENEYVYDNVAGLNLAVQYPFVNVDKVIQQPERIVLAPQSLLVLEELPKAVTRRLNQLSLKKSSKISKKTSKKRK